MSDGLVVRDLTVEYHNDAGTLRGADGVGFSVNAGERLGIVGGRAPASRPPRWR